MGGNQPTGVENPMMDLSQISVLDSTGVAVKLDSLWRSQPAVVVFVRHFG